MEKIIEIDVSCKEDLFEKYNKKEVSRELINYLMESTLPLLNQDPIKLIINNGINEKIDITELIKEGLQKEYRKNLHKYFHNNVQQVIFLIIGVILLFIYTLIEGTVLKEIILISGWMFIWVLLETEIYADTKSKMKRKIIEKLLNSEIEEIKKK